MVLGHFLWQQEVMTPLLSSTDITSLSPTGSDQCWSVLSSSEQFCSELLWWSKACSLLCVWALVHSGGVLVAVCQLWWWWALMGGIGWWLTSIVGSGCHGWLGWCGIGGWAWWASQTMVVVGEEDYLAVHDAKPNIGICWRLFGKVATRMSYID